MTTKKALQVLGVFLSFFFILFGTYITIDALQVRSHPDADPTLPFHFYYIEERNYNSDMPLLIGCAMISAGLTFLWLQRRKET